MSFWMLLFTTHLLVMAYCFFLIWKDDRIYQGQFADEMINDRTYGITHQDYNILIMVSCCCPLFNLVTLCVWLRCELVNLLRTILWWTFRLLFGAKPSVNQ